MACPADRRYLNRSENTAEIQWQPRGEERTISILGRDRVFWWVNLGASSLESLMPSLKAATEHVLRQDR